MWPLHLKNRDKKEQEKGQRKTVVQSLKHVTDLSMGLCVLRSILGSIHDHLTKETMSPFKPMCTVSFHKSKGFFPNNNKMKFKSGLSLCLMLYWK